MVNGVPQQGDIIKLNLNPRMGHEQQGFLVTLVYKAHSFNFVEKVPSDFLLQLLDITRRIFTV